MTANRRDELKNAQNLIKQGDKKGAIKIIKPILKHDKDVVAAWWLLANAVDNTKHKKQALEQVLRLRPGEARAQKMLNEIAPPKPTPKTDIFDDPFADLDDDLDQADLGGDPFDDPFGNSDDDPFGDDPFEDDPFAGISGGSGGLSRSRQPASSPLRTKTTTRNKSGGSNTALIIALGLIVGVVVVGGAIAIIASGLSGGRPDASGHCDVPNASLVTCVDITFDQLWTGNIAESQTHNWTFQGRAGQNIHLEANGLDSTADTILTLYSPSGQQIAYNDNNGDDRDSLISQPLPTSGEYRIAVSMVGIHTGRYEVYLTEGSSTNDNCPRGQSDCGFVSLGDTVRGSLNGNDDQYWSFSVQAGQRITITVDGSASTDTTLRVYDPDGNELAYNDDIDLAGGNLDSELQITFSVAGTYRIAVNTFGFADGTYSLRLR